MKILIVLHDHNMSGANMSLLNLLKTKKETDEFLVAFPRYSKDTFDKFEKIGCTCITVKHFLVFKKNICSFEYLLKNTFRRCYQYIAFQRDLNKAVESIRETGFEPDYVITNSFADVFGYLLSEKLSVPHIFYIREFMEDDHQLSHIRKDIDVMCQNSYAIFISQSIEKFYLSKYSFKGTFRIYNYIEPPMNAIKKCRSDVLKLCMVGTLQYGKGQHFLLEVLKKVEEDGYAGRFTVEFAGEGPMRDSLEKYANQYLSSDVKFMGQVSDVYSFYGSNDVLVVCSNREALGRIVVEAFYTYKYIVGPDTGEISYLLDSQRGFIYEHDNKESLVKIIEDLLDNKIQDQINLIDNREFALKKFAANQYMDIRKQLDIWGGNEY